MVWTMPPSSEPVKSLQACCFSPKELGGDFTPSLAPRQPGPPTLRAPPGAFSISSCMGKPGFLPCKSGKGSSTQLSPPRNPANYETDVLVDIYLVFLESIK